MKKPALENLHVICLLINKLLISLISLLSEFWNLFLLAHTEIILFYLLQIRHWRWKTSCLVMTIFDDTVLHVYTCLIASRFEKFFITYFFHVYSNPKNILCFLSVKRQWLYMHVFDFHFIIVQVNLWATPNVFI